MKLNKPIFDENSACDWCCNNLKPFTLIFEVKKDTFNDDWICLNCAKQQK